MSMPLKEWLIKRLSLQLRVPEKIIDVVITDQFVSAFQATTNHNSIELSGFGKFVFSQTKAAKQMAKYESQKSLYETILNNSDISEEQRRNNMMRLATTNKNIEHLKPKIR